MGDPEEAKAAWEKEQKLKMAMLDGGKGALAPSTLHDCRNPNESLAVGSGCKSDLNCFTQISQGSLQTMVKNEWETIDAQTGYRKVKAIVDSGASNSVASGSLAPEVIATPSEGSKRGQTYVAVAK